MSVFGDAEFVKKVKADFICVAVNQHHHRRRKDLEYDLFEKLVEQTGEKVSGYNQGLYFFTPSAELLGYVTAKEGALTRFDIVVNGHYWGEGRYTRNGPEGKFPFAVAFRLSDGTEPHDIPPPGVR